MRVDLEIKFTMNLSETDAALINDEMEQGGIKLEEFAKTEVYSKIMHLVHLRKKEIGQILALKGEINDQVRIESAKLAEARKSPW